MIHNIDLKFTRTYNSKNTSSNILGKGWTFGFSSKVEINSLDTNVIYEYLPNGSINTLTQKDQERNIETYEYDSNNNKTKYIDKNGNVTIYEYDNKNKLTKVTNALNEVNTYTYDNKGNMLTQKDAANNVIEFVYDINSNEIKK